MIANASRSRILLVCRRGLLGEGLRLFFERSRSIQVVGMIPQLTTAKRVMRACCPDVILLVTREVVPVKVPGQLLRAFPASGRVITVRVEDSTTTVFTGSRRPVTVRAATPAQLVRLITHGSLQTKRTRTPARPRHSGAGPNSEVVSPPPGSTSNTPQRKGGRVAPIRRKTGEVK
jgi:hypothetical protein